MAEDRETSALSPNPLPGSDDNLSEMSGDDQTPTEENGKASFWIGKEFTKQEMGCQSRLVLVVTSEE